MTPRAIIIGILGAILMGAGGRYASNHIPGMHGVVSGHLPVTVYGLMIVFCAGINLLLGKIRKSWRFKASEVAVILALLLAGCSIPTAGLMRYFPRTLVHPIVNNQKEPSWQQSKLLEETPSVLLANGGKFDEAVVGNYLAPMGDKGKPISFTQVPWYAWRTPLIVWGSIIILTFMGTIGLSVLLHWTWARQERLRYPLALIATSLLEEDDKGKVKLFSEKGFWVAATIILAVRLLNGLHYWFPNSIELPLSFDFSALQQAMPEFMATPGAGTLTQPTIFPACVGLTFLLAADIGLSLGIAHLFGVVVLFLMFAAGVDTSGGAMTGDVLQWLSLGSFVAMAVMLVYIGRRYYWLTFKEAVTFRRQPETHAEGVWGLRTFIVCMVGVVVILSAVGMEWPVSIVTVAMIVLTYVICARMVAECGTFFFEPAWYLPGVVVGLFGATALGPKNMIILGLLFFVLTVDMFEGLMAFVVNGLKVTSDTGVKTGRMGLLIGLAVLLTIAVAVPTALWSDYNHAADMRHGWDTKTIYSAANKVSQDLRLSKTLDEVKNYSSLQRITHMRPDSRFFVAGGIGFALLLGCSIARLRFPWWPLHPVLFLAFGSPLLGKFCFSFFLGWVLRVSVMKFGGTGAYTKARPIVLGVILGDLAGGFLLMFIGWVYYSIMGTSGTSIMMW